MTASIQPESKVPSRRALLAGALGGLGAWAASAIGRATPARAADGQTVLVGGEYTATSVTRFTNLTTGASVLKAESDFATAIAGTSDSGLGVEARSDSGIAVYANSPSGQGVFASSVSGRGVHGVSLGTGVAIEGFGRIKFSTSGVATITAGNTSVTITPGVLVSPGSFVLLTPKVNLGGRDLWFTTDPTE